jgi:chorismate mutase
MVCLGIRGATSVAVNDAGAILTATRTLLEQIVSANNVSVEGVASVIFTVTPDLNATYPARAAREMGWVNTPLLCMQDIAVEDGLPRCIRVLLHWNTDLAPERIRHVYLGKARTLRPDLLEEEEK